MIVFELTVDGSISLKAMEYKHFNQIKDIPGPGSILKITAIPQEPIEVRRGTLMLKQCHLQVTKLCGEAVIPKDKPKELSQQTNQIVQSQRTAQTF